MAIVSPLPASGGGVRDIRAYLEYLQTRPQINLPQLPSQDAKTALLDHLANHTNYCPCSIEHHKASSHWKAKSRTPSNASQISQKSIAEAQASFKRLLANSSETSLAHYESHTSNSPGHRHHHHHNHFHNHFHNDSENMSKWSKFIHSFKSVSRSPPGSASASAVIHMPGRLVVDGQKKDRQMDVIIDTRLPYSFLDFDYTMSEMEITRYLSCNYTVKVTIADDGYLDIHVFKSDDSDSLDEEEFVTFMDISPYHCILGIDWILSLDKKECLTTCAETQK